MLTGVVGLLLCTSSGETEKAIGRALAAVALAKFLEHVGEQS